MNPLKHLLAPRSALRRRFPPHALNAIEEAIAASEKRHRAEIRVVIEAALSLSELRRYKTARERALEVFAQRGLWKTAEKNGVLIYVLIAERRAEIVADVGCRGKVSDAEWDRVREVIERRFREDRWLEGILEGIDSATEPLERAFPADGENPSELPDRPAQL